MQARHEAMIPVLHSTLMIAVSFVTRVSGIGHLRYPDCDIS